MWYALAWLVWNAMRVPSGLQEGRTDDVPSAVICRIGPAANAICALASPPMTARHQSRKSSFKVTVRDVIKLARFASLAPCGSRRAAEERAKQSGCGPARAAHQPGLVVRRGDGSRLQRGATRAAPVSTPVSG